MKILVVSDTHRERTKIKKVIDKVQPDRLFHLGDAQGDLEYIKDIANCPVDAVKGNCDDDIQLPLDILVELEGKRFFLTHGHRYSVNYDLLRLEMKGREVKADVVFYGHTHVPYLHLGEDMVIANPGSLSFPRQAERLPAYLVCEITPDGQILYNPQTL